MIGRSPYPQRPCAGLETAGRVAVLVLVLVWGAQETARAAERIVSMNLCTDHLVWELADREKILSLSFNSTFAEQSLIADQIDRIVVNRGLAEEIVPLAPDVVFTSNFTTPFAGRILRRRGFSVVEVPMPLDLDDIRANIRQVAEALGETARGEKAIAALDAGLAALKAPTGGPRRSAVVLMPGGFTAGSDTIAHDLLSLAGLVNAIAEDGVAGWINLSVERFLSVKPDVIVLGAEERAAYSISNAWLDHPALRRFVSERLAIPVPSRLWSCGTSSFVDALAILRRALDAEAVEGPRP